MSEHIGLLEEVRNMYPELDVYEKGTVAALKRENERLKKLALDIGDVPGVLNTLLDSKP